MRKTDTFFGVSCADATAIRTAGNGIVHAVVLKWGADVAKNDDRDLIEHSKGLLLVSCAELLEARERLEGYRGKLTSTWRETPAPKLLEAATELCKGFDSMLDSAGGLLRSCESLVGVAQQVCSTRESKLVASRCLHMIDALHGDAKRMMFHAAVHNIETILCQFRRAEESFRIRAAAEPARV